MSMAAEKLLSHWKNQGLALANGNSEEALTEFESKNSVLLPSDMRHYFAAANGMPNNSGSDVDSNGFRFWALDQIRPLPSAGAEAGVPIPAVEDPSRYFVFADYFDWSWAYAIDLGGGHVQRVIHVGTVEPKIVAQSFAEFVDLYVEDARELYVLAAEH